MVAQRPTQDRLTGAALSVALFGAAVAHAGVGDTTVATWKDNYAGAVSLTIDDTGYDRVDTLEILDDYGVKGTFFLNTGLLSQSSFLQNKFLAASQNGHEIGGHTVTHPDLVLVSDSQLAFELDDAQSYLETLTGKPVVSFAYPFGSDDARVRAAVGQRYLAARDVWPDAIHPATGQNMLRLGEAVGPFNWTDEQFVQERLAFATEAETTGGWAVEMYHNLGAPGSLNRELFHTEAALRGHLANLTSGDLSVWVAPMGDVARYYLSREGTLVSASTPTPNQVNVDLSLTDPTGRIATPLTLTTEVPAGWNTQQLQVAQDGQPIPFTIDDSGASQLVSYNAVPNAGTVVLSVAIEGLPGDFNDDGTVDAADFTVWRDGLDSEFTLPQYDEWASNFGNTSASPTQTTIPEPRTGLLVLGATLLASAARKDGESDRSGGW